MSSFFMNPSYLLQPLEWQWRAKTGQASFLFPIFQNPLVARAAQGLVVATPFLFGWKPDLGSTQQWHKRHKKQVVWEAKLPPVARQSFTQILNPSTTKCEIVTMLAGANSYLSTTPKLSQDPHQHNSHLFQPMTHTSPAAKFPSATSLSPHGSRRDPSLTFDLPGMS